MITTKRLSCVASLLVMACLLQYAVADSSQLSTIDFSKCTGTYDSNARELTMTCPGFFNIKTISIESDVAEVCSSERFGDLSKELPFNLLYIFISNDASIGVCDYYKPGKGYLFSNVKNLLIGVRYLSSRVGTATDLQYMNMGTNVSSSL